MKIRLPAIARDVLKENDLPKENVDRLQALIEELPGSWLRPLRDRGAPDLQAWEQYLEPYQGMDWLQAPWLITEIYFYRRVLEATGYFEPGPGQGVDPYALHKQRGLHAAQGEIRTFARQLETCLADVQAEPRRRFEILPWLLRASVWGNQADLSIWPAGQETGPANNRQPSREISHLLIDDSPTVVSYLAELAETPGRIDLILDNTALELVHDLGLADFLLASRLAASIYLHFKAYPTYVSDATVPDFKETLAFLASQPQPECRELADRLQVHLAQGRLQVKDNLLWNAPLVFFDVPKALQEALGPGATPVLLISKGDVNYRRFLGDLHWPFDTPLAEVLPSPPTPLLLLRVVKSDVLVGLPPEQPSRLERDDPGWTVSGEWGVVQFHRRSAI